MEVELNKGSAEYGWVAPIFSWRGLSCTGLSFMGFSCTTTLLNWTWAAWGSSCTGVQLYEGSFKRGFSSMKVQLNRFSCMDVELHEGSVAWGFSYVRDQLDWGSGTRRFSCTLVQMHEGSVERVPLKRGFSCNLNNVFC